MKLEKINALINKGRIKAIIKQVGSRRMCIGFERLNKRSRKYKVKYMTNPIDLDLLTKPQPEPEQPVELMPEPPSSADWIMSIEPGSESPEMLEILKKAYGDALVEIAAKLIGTRRELTEVMIELDYAALADPTAIRTGIAPVCVWDEAEGWVSTAHKKP